MNRFLERRFKSLRSQSIFIAVVMGQLLLFCELASTKDFSIRSKYQGQVCVTGRAYQHITILTSWWFTSFHPIKNVEVASRQRNLSPLMAQTLSTQLKMFEAAKRTNSPTTKTTAYNAEFTVPDENFRTRFKLFNIARDKIRVSDKTASLKYGRCRAMFVIYFMLS